MLLSSLLVIPLLGIFLISSNRSYEQNSGFKSYKTIAFITTILNLIVSLIIFILFDFSSNQFQFVEEHYNINYFDIYLGVDGISIYFVLLTTIIMPIAILSNWNSITDNIKSFLIIMLLLETLLIAVFLVLDIFLFYIFFESILPPLFLLIGLFGSSNKVRASFYLFLYTLIGSLFLLLSILAMSSIMGTTDYDALFKSNFDYTTQIFLFIGIFIAFAVKTPTIFLNNWLLKAHVESPLGGSIVLAAIVLKLSLYGIFRLILPILPKASLDYSFIVFLIGVITIIYASFSTIRTSDIKELIAYSSVSHAAVYLIAVFTNTIQGIQGGIILGLAHGFASSGLFICAGGVLYDRTGTRLIYYYRGVTQMMPLFSIFFFILCLANCGAPLTLNFVGEFLSLYGVFEKLPVLGLIASSSIVFSAAYTIYMFNRICFGGSFSKYFAENIHDLTKREFFLLLPLILPTIILGLYPVFVLTGLDYNVSSLLYHTGVILQNSTEILGNIGVQDNITGNIFDLNKNNMEDIFRGIFYGTSR
jgi:NADH-ubiquinone oxidoreductase chain 4